jgi:hypothetical protein
MTDYSLIDAAKYLYNTHIHQYSPALHPGVQSCLLIVGLPLVTFLGSWCDVPYNKLEACWLHGIAVLDEPSRFLFGSNKSHANHASFIAVQ